MNKEKTDIIPIIEGILFLVGEDGINAEDIALSLEVTKDKVVEALEQLNTNLKDDIRGLTIKKFGDNYKLTTKSIHAKYYQKLTELTSSRTLSQSALETLAIIAYNEPITRYKVDELRGIQSSQMIRNLIAKDLVKEVGRSEEVGRPIMYGITQEFLDYFGLTSKDDLPKVDFNQNGIEDEVDLYKSKYSEEKESVEQL